jgi:Trk K+ transport system NAD-binding subunit/Kef-type K+ transport system membrane component KefB
MQDYRQILLVLVGFIVVAISSNQISQYFKKIKLPLITGLLFVGIACGPFLLQLIPDTSLGNLRFINDIALAFIAFAASAELYLKDMRRQINSIKWMTFGQLFGTFVLSAIAVFFLSEYIPFMKDMSASSKLAVSLLMAAIFVPTSPASAIAIINETRAKGPFTSATLGVTVLKDFLVIILFAICFNVADALITGKDFGFSFIAILLLELALSFGLGLLIGRILRFILSRYIHKYSKTLLILGTGYATYLLAHFVKDYTLLHYDVGFHVEPLLICIIGSFWVSNYTKFRHEFINIIDEVGPLIYISFFTLAGASLSLDVLWEVGMFALILFVIRLVTIILGSYFGSTMGGDSSQVRRISWMPYVTQAGVGLGLATIVEGAYPDWGNEFATLVIAVIVINQVVGPPLFKWAIHKVGENHDKANTQEFDGIRDAIIFGLESQSIALARQLNKQGWLTKIITKQKDFNGHDYDDLEIHFAEEVTLELLDKLDAKKSEGIVLMHTDDENFAICEMIYENIGTENIVVRVNNHYNMKKFHDLGALVVNPSTAIVSLMDHFVRSPQATSLLLGMQKNQDSLDLEVLNPDLFGKSLRDLRLPADIIILSIKRKGQMIISHGYTRLRKGDLVTLVGSNEGLDKMTLMFDK